MSAAERHEVGWPDADLVVAVIEWMRNRRAFSRSASRFTVMAAPSGILVIVCLAPVSPDAAFYRTPAPLPIRISATLWLSRKSSRRYQLSPAIMDVDRTGA